ncbi:hypothetical protein NO263_08910 [Gluconacetobacter entanii]|uniref:Uncharacterized protein n=1 Tax=Gluconacetobacter entanii TaxID=108528 RepID=A0A318Q9V5_9PROT|nr:hypothetical protein [Gluconacetobacter entanii]MCE2578789.1 hypothetical protein [Komagataeibacter sp. FNDCR1]MCW4581592.1 hypothetical protein [Gluconacetobacter entanii]MCW4584986.1 hypothetical protein [Gluconacetobacter entanii]MCW4588400.1 hypothetical protein [Gluconacetobacter entanii]MCW4590699.1 hypothetical protein [Gluconacetobacter entanii]
MTTFHTLPTPTQVPARGRDTRATPAQAGSVRSALRPAIRPLALMLCLVSLAGCYGGRDWHHHHRRDGYYGGGYYGGRGGPGGGYGHGPGGGRGW